MGGKSTPSPLAVAKQVNRLLNVGLLKHEPVWYQPVLNTPPMTDFARKPAQTHQTRSWNRENDIREIQKIHQGVELYLRKKFYKEHPWELARPRVVVEEDGADYVRQDWSRMEQNGKPLDGESVVQRTLYLMRETKSPVDRYKEIHGFDESKARGRPTQTLAKYGNIQEVNEDVDRILRTWNEVTTELDNLIIHRQRFNQELQSLAAENSTLNSQDIKSRQDDLRARNKLIKIQIHRLQKKVRKMSRLSMQEAYLQACSEFYMLRQQEETAIRIAIEQAKCFRREMGPTVNERELVKEQQALKEWRHHADKHHMLLFEAKKRVNGVDKPGMQAEQTETDDSETVEDVEETLDQ